MYKNFVLDCLEEGLFIDEIDDYVEYWHTHETNMSLCEFLGFTDEEYLQLADIWKRCGERYTLL